MAIESRILKAKSPGKLNLTFDIVGDLADGYHEVETLMQAVDLEDELTFTFAPADAFDVEISDIKYEGCSGNIPTDKTNLIAKAIDLFHRNQGTTIGYKVSVALRKSVPVAGGMGGGSGNAAAALVAMNAFFDNPFNDGQLVEMAAKLGADVPFFLKGGTQIGRRRGDVLTAVEIKTALHFLIVSPNALALQTQSIYSAYDKFVSNQSIVHPNTEACARALRNGDLSEASQHFGNVFEPLLFSQFDQLRQIRDQLVVLGGSCTHITGSGPTSYVWLLNAEDGQFLKHAIEQTDMNIKCWIANAVAYGACLTE